MRQLGTATRRLLPNPLVDGLEVKLVQAGHPYGLDLPRILGIKITLAVLAAFLLVLVGPAAASRWSPPGCCSSCPTTG